MEVVGWFINKEIKEEVPNLHLILRYFKSK